jgi:xanthine dehydrogenase molybdopterin-binding subunit B
LNVGFLPKNSNQPGFMNSKAIEEAPFLLAHSVAFSIVDALKAARKQNGLNSQFPLDLPFSAPKIRSFYELSYNSYSKSFYKVFLD